MTTEKKSGRPKLAEREESKKLLVRFRPRYKEMLELLARHRQTSLNETIEYCIAKISRDYLIEGKSVYDWLVPLTESTQRLYLSTEDLGGVLSILNKKEDWESIKLEISNLKKLPDSMKKGDEFFVNKVIEKFDVDSLSYFNYEKLVSSLKEDWKDGRAYTHVIKDIKAILALISTREIRPFNKDLMPSKLKQYVSAIIEKSKDIKI